MGKKAKKAMKKNLKRASFNKNPSEDADFLVRESMLISCALNFQFSFFFISFFACNLCA